MTVYSCRVCRFETDSPRGIVAHSRKHKNRFEDLVGRRPEDYDEVVELFRGQPTLFTPYDDEQTTIFDHD